MDERHRQIVEIALRAAGGEYGLALAGGYAVRAHGMGNRPSGDVDLFTDWDRRADFPAAVMVVNSVIGLYYYLAWAASLYAQPAADARPPSYRISWSDGLAIGVTLGHPHGQIYAYPYVTPRSRLMLGNASRHFERTGQNLFADVLAGERSSGERVVV